MATAKDIRVEPISSADARRTIAKLHYSGKNVTNSQLHLGAFLDGRLEGAMSFGPSLDKRKIQSLVRDTEWNDFIELNRMAFSDALPRNSESRALGIAFRIIRKQYPNIEWCVSFSDGTQCGDGTIYRASGFVLTGIKENTQMWQAPNGDVFSRMSLTNKHSVTQKKLARDALGLPHVMTTKASMEEFVKAGMVPLPGFQLRYIYFLNPAARDRLTVPVLPFSRIDEMGAGMYKGKARVKQATEGDQPEGGGAAPTHALQSPTIEDDATEARRA
jgi:hypothetical protein